MALDLDLAGSWAKVARAATHIKVLDGKITRAMEQGGPLKVTSELAPNHREAKAFFEDNPEFDGHALGVIYGEIIFNLRCALDYLITELVDASDAQLLKHHQFPIYQNATNYRKAVWRPGEPIGRGCLNGIVHGLALLDSAQPFHTQPDPQTNTLWLLQQLSNADKHRKILATSILPKDAEVGFVGLGDLRFQVKAQAADAGKWDPTRTDNKVEVLHIRTDRPIPGNAYPRVGVTAQMMFALEPLVDPGADQPYWLFNMSNVRDGIKAVRDLLNQFTIL